jgi:hypothetical protein
MAPAVFLSPVLLEQIDTAKVATDDNSDIGKAKGVWSLLLYLVRYAEERGYLLCLLWVSTAMYHQRV